MAFIDIHTNNLSRQLRNSATYLDNWVYIPGTAITGDWQKPVAIRSLDDFQKLYGTYSPEDSITYEYVAGLLSAGLPVLFRRVAYKNQNNLTEYDIQKAETYLETDYPEGEKPDDYDEVVAKIEDGVTRAKLILTHNVNDTIIQDLEIKEKFGGSYGNNINITIRAAGNNSYEIVVYNGAVVLESNRFVKIPTSVSTQVEVNQKIIDALLTLQLDRVEINVLETDPTKFQLPICTQSYLMGGTDMDETLVPAEIPASISVLYDKILYQPKFLTSGGYTDENMLTSAPIAQALRELSRVRQDCRALIDIPIGVPFDKQQEYASTVAYQQTTSNEVIPSASMCAPWCYMQIGNEQLWMPPSYVFLTVVGADLVKGGKAYTPKAGITSGRVSNVIKPEFDIGSDIAEEWQSDSEVNINPIMRLQSGSYVIAGNSTLLLVDTDLDEINAFQESSADLTVIEIRRFIYNLATELQYQYNSTNAFETFSLRAAKFFETMISESSMSNYTIANISTDDEPRKLKIRVDVYLTPTIKKIEIFLNVAYGSVEISTGGVE